MPLEVDLWGWSPSLQTKASTRFMERLSAESHRWSSLVVPTTSARASEGLQWIFALPLPLLERLNVNGVQGLSFAPNSQAAVIDGVQKENILRLRSISLDNVASWPTTTLVGLTELKLSRIDPRGAGVAPSLQAFMDVLAASPSLVALRLHYILIVAEVRTPRRPVILPQLPELRSVDLLGTSEEVKSIFAPLLGQCTQVHINFGGTVQTPTSALLDSIASSCKTVFGREGLGEPVLEVASSLEPTWGAGIVLRTSGLRWRVDGRHEWLQHYLLGLRSASSFNNVLEHLVLVVSEKSMDSILSGEQQINGLHNHRVLVAINEVFPNIKRLTLMDIWKYQDYNPHNYLIQRDLGINRDPTNIIGALDTPSSRGEYLFPNLEHVAVHGELKLWKLDSLFQLVHMRSGQGMGLDGVRPIVSVVLWRVKMLRRELPVLPEGLLRDLRRVIADVAFIEVD